MFFPDDHENLGTISGYAVEFSLVGNYSMVQGTGCFGKQ